MYDIHSGAFDYNTVLKRTIENMTKSGLRWIDYESGWHNRVPVAARRAVMTGFRQVQGKINEQTAEALGTDSYEVTVHIGARPTHQVWEGKIWTMTQLRTVCGLGEVTGLHGANCYHDYNPFIPGVDVPEYSQAELDQIHRQENTPKRYNGKEYTTYEALQRQRKLETKARKYREDVHLLEEGGGSEDDIIAKKCRYQGTLQEYRDFSKKMDLPMQKERIYQDGLKVDMRAPKSVAKKASATTSTASGDSSVLELIKRRGTDPMQHGFSCFPEDDVLREYAKRIKPKQGFFDVSMHGEPKLICFGTKKGNMGPSLLAELIKRHPDYNGEKIRLLCCRTGETAFLGEEDYCFAEELSNIMGVTVEAPDELLYINHDGTFFVGRKSKTQLVPFEPNQRRRLK